MNTSYSETFSAQVSSESAAFSVAQEPLSHRQGQHQTRWINKIQWRSLINKLFGYSVGVGVLLAAVSMPIPAWIVTAVGLMAIATPDINKAIADMMMVTFTVIAVGILWHGFSLVSGLHMGVAILAYGAIVMGLIVGAIALLLVISSALMATNNRSKFLDASYFNRYQSQVILAGTSVAGLSIGYWVMALVTAQ